MLQGPADVGFVSVVEDGVVVAKGRVACDGDWAGITDVWVSPDHRRRGLALVVMAELLEWSAERGAGTAYLQVRGDNAPGLALYAGLGFRTHHTYRYLGPGGLTCAPGSRCSWSALVAGLTVDPRGRAEDSPRYAVITFHKNYREHVPLDADLGGVPGRPAATRTSLERLEWRAGSGYFRDATRLLRARTAAGCPTARYRPRLFARLPRQPDQGPRDLPRPEGLRATAPCAPTCSSTPSRAPAQRQCPDRQGDQVCRWEYPRINDYRSYGCVKLSPGDLHELYDAWRRWFPLGSPTG